MRPPTTRRFRRRNLCRLAVAEKRWEKNRPKYRTRPFCRSPWLRLLTWNRRPLRSPPSRALAARPKRLGIGSARAETQVCRGGAGDTVCRAASTGGGPCPPSRNRTPPSPLRRHHPPMRCLSGLASVVTQNSLRVLHVDSCQPRPQVSLAPTAPRPSAALGAAQPSWMPPEERQLLWLPTGEHGPQP